MIQQLEQQIALLKIQLLLKEEQIKSKEEQIKSKEEQLQRKNERILYLERQLFGRRSEKKLPNYCDAQLSLFDAEQGGGCPISFGHSFLCFKTSYFHVFFVVYLGTIYYL